MIEIMKAVSIFVVAGFVGPLLRLAMWQIKPGTDIYVFLYNSILLMWPTQPFAVMEASVGTLIAGLISLSSNIIIFAFIGFIVGSLLKWRNVVWICYALTCCFIFWFAWWGAGYSFSYIHWLSLAIVLLIYAIPFYAVTKVVPRKTFA